MAQPQFHDVTSIGFDESSRETPILDLPPYGSCNLHRWRPGHHLERHDHKDWQIIGVLDGLLEVDFGTGWKPLRPGWVHVLPPGHPHRLRSPTGHAQLGINLRAASNDQRGMRAALQSVFSGPSVLADAVDLEACHRIARYRQVWNRLGRAVLAQAIDGWIVQLCLRCDDAAADVDDRLVQWLQSHCDRPVRVAEVAQALGLSRSSLQARCQSSFACGVARLHERLRLERAARLLRERRGDSIATIAEACGYTDQATFSRRFKAFAGSSPSRWRVAE
ncbi:MAG: AraC family transcriptional regulator [Planctomycetota bacterium]|nr:AraC family transcriptional regulator [Planctomycetota bacterium]